MIVTLIVCVAAAWWYLAPTRIGGSTTYVATHGISMEPRFHTGDLAMVRPEATYKVGDVVAYHSDLLHTVVLHRIVARRGSLYIFKGDNNDFIDPAPVPRADLIGKLWLHVPHGGVALAMVHSPIGAASLCAFVGLFLVVGTTETRRRRRRRRAGATESSGLGLNVKSALDRVSPRPVNHRVLLTVFGAAAGVFLALAVFAFTRPDHTTSSDTTPYTQTVKFGYSARAQGGPVYPTGRITTGDPIFLSLVHRLRIHIDYDFATAAGHELAGTESVILQLAGQSGWSRTIVLVPRTRFVGDHTSTDVTLDLPQLESLLTKVGALTGTSSDAGYTISVEPRVQIAGTVAGHAVNTRFDPAMNFQLGPAQLAANGASSTTGGTSAGAPPGGSAGSSQASFTPSQSASVGTVTRKAGTLGLLGVSLDVAIVRWLALVGLLISAAIALSAFLRRTAEPFQETARIQSQYGHMIVPIVAGEDLGWPPVDVPNIKALVRLAESGQRLILHTRANDVDTYLVNDEGTVYRYQVQPSNVVWGEWSEAGTPVKAAA